MHVNFVLKNKWAEMHVYTYSWNVDNDFTLWPGYGKNIIGKLVT